MSDERQIAAIESGLDVKAINDPFVPLQYMVYTLKFDLAMSPGGVDTQSKRINSNQSKKQEIYSVRENHDFDIQLYNTRIVPNLDDTR